MWEVGECSNPEDDINCPHSTSSTTTTLTLLQLEKGQLGWSHLHNVWEPHAERGPLEVPGQEELSKNFSIRCSGSTRAGMQQGEPYKPTIPCPKDKLNQSLEIYEKLKLQQPDLAKLSNATQAEAMKVIDKMIQNITGEVPQVNYTYNDSLASFGIYRMTLMPPPSPTAVERTADMDVSSGNIKQVLDILEALPSKTSDVEKFLKQVEQNLSSSSGSRPFQASGNFSEYLSKEAAEAPDTPASRNFTDAFETADSKQERGRSGSGCDRGGRFRRESSVSVALAKALANLAGAASEDVKVDVTIPQAMLLSEVQKRIKGNVNVAYMIEVYKQDVNKGNASQVASVLASLIQCTAEDINTVTSEIRRQVSFSGQNFALRAVSLSVTILPVSSDGSIEVSSGSGEGESDNNSLVEDMCTTTLMTPSCHGGQQTHSPQDAVPTAMLDGKAKAPTSAEAMVETAQQRVAEIAKVASAKFHPQTVLGTDKDDKWSNRWQRVARLFVHVLQDDLPKDPQDEKRETIRSEPGLKSGTARHCLAFTAALPLVMKLLEVMPCDFVSLPIRGGGHVDMPRVMLGTGGHEGLSGRVGRAAILAALKMGYRGIDTSEMNRNLTDIRWACKRSGLAREDYFLVVKIPPWSHGHDGVLQSFRRQTSQLAVDYVDLLLIQWPHVWSLEQRDWGPAQWSRRTVGQSRGHCQKHRSAVAGNGGKDCHMRHMLSPSVDGKTGTGTLSQVQACQRQVSELRASLSLLAERCGCLEDVHKGAIDRLRVFGSPKPGATLEQLKKQSMAKVKALQSRHGELMSKLQEELSLSCERSEPMPMTEKVKTPAVLKGAAAVQSPDLSKPEADDGAGLAAPLTLESENGHEQMDVSSVTVMPMDGRVGKLNSRLRFHDIQAKSAPDRLAPQGLPKRTCACGATTASTCWCSFCVSTWSSYARAARALSNASSIPAWRILPSESCAGSEKFAPRLDSTFSVVELPAPVTESALRDIDDQVSPVQDRKSGIVSMCCRTGLRDHHHERAGQTKASLRGETWRAMEELLNSGRARAIGVSNHTIEDMEAILHGCAVAPMVMQGESHPHWPNRSVRDWCRKQSIAFQGYAPFGGQETERNSGHRPVDDPTVLSVAEKRELTPFQVCMQWNQARNSSTVVKSKDSRRLRENLAACGEMRCTATDLGRIDERAKEFLKYGPCYWGHNDMDYLHPWKDEEKMWDAMLPGGQEVCGRF
eukprot:s2280_g6.t3